MDRWTCPGAPGCGEWQSWVPSPALCEGQQLPCPQRGGISSVRPTAMGGERAGCSEVRGWQFRRERRRFGNGSFPYKVASEASLLLDVSDFGRDSDIIWKLLEVTAGGPGQIPVTALVCARATGCGQWAPSVPPHTPSVARPGCWHHGVDMRRYTVDLVGGRT